MSIHERMTTKKERALIFNKYGGRCAYCGEELTKGWHVDEVKPILRNKVWCRKKRKYIYNGTCKHPERLHIDNQMPACASCNINKHTSSLEEFRAMIAKFMNSLNRYSVQYRVAKRYGLIEEVPKPVVFYFETLNT